MEYRPRASSNFPTNWVDPLELYGNFLHDLVASGHDLEAERSNIKSLIDRYGAPWVWDNRRRLFQMVQALKGSAGKGV